MGFALGQLEEADGVAVPITLKTRDAQERVLECDGQGRAVGPQGLAFSLGNELNLAKRAQGAIRVTLEYLRPSRQSLGPRPQSAAGLVQLRDASNLVSGSEFHLPAPFSEEKIGDVGRRRPF